ncbi:MAG TPA: alpha-amylase family glycosyl hydrolase [Vicinamibacterales bacterium]|nr:alpha-amylase family glycosyl hydrolase [Vicinamibacterales bacterium]
MGTKVRHPHLLELSAWPWLERLSLRYGRGVSLATVPSAEWDALKDRGFHLVFLMGVWQRSPLSRRIALDDPDLRAEYSHVLPDWTAEDVIGSPYSVQAWAPDGRMGAWAGVDAARRELNARGMGLLLDFVPNHLAFDHDWITLFPERFVTGDASDLLARPAHFRQVATVSGPRIIACGRDPHFLPWTDVAQLNYFNPATRTAMIEVLAEIAAHCDGVRCDMSMLVLNEVFSRTWRPVLRDEWPTLPEEFWPQATNAVPDLLYLAEVYWDLEWTLQQQGFHYTYDKRLLDRLLAAPTRDVRGHLMADAAYRDRLARFLENHDEPRSAAVFGDALPAAATMVATLPGLRFFFDGQTEGRRLRTPLQLARWPDEAEDEAVRDVYARLLATTRAPLFHEGTWSLLDVRPAGDGRHDDLIAYRWRLGGELAVVVVNLGSAAAEAHVGIAGDLPAGESFAFTDRLCGRTWHVNRHDLDSRGLYVRLEAGQAHLFADILPSRP